MLNSEQLLHYIWRNRLYNTDSLITEDGVKVEVIDPGLHNENAGPDFFNSKIKTRGKVWAGNVEIHRTSSDWVKHGHHKDKAYNSVILHLVEEIDTEVVNENGQKVTQCRVMVHEQLRKSAEYLINSKYNLPCQNFLSSIPKVKLNAWLSYLTLDRLERKADDINKHLSRFNNSWDEVFYVVLSRNYGFGINSEEFERLALSLQYKYILKHSDSLFQIEALMFGQAGLLERTLQDDYYMSLKNEYKFFKSKYKLKSIDGYVFKKMRVRPVSFPEMRIAQLAALLQKSGRLFSTILEMKDYREFFNYLQTEPSDYWQSHYSFGNRSAKSKKLLGAASLDIIVINTIVTMLFAYGKKSANEEYCSRAIEILESINPENNRIVREFIAAGVVPSNAADSQAVIQLRKEYCEKRKCLYCRYGHSLLSTDNFIR
jgi:hypothetical protein